VDTAGASSTVREAGPEGASMSDRRRRDAPILGDRRDSERDRRTAPRYPTRGAPAVITWAEDNEYQTIEAVLIDISMGGFSAWVENFPPRGQPVWLRLDGETPSAWLKASVIATNKTGFLFWNRRRVRFRFLEACPYDFFKAAVEGFAEEVYRRNEKLEGFYRRHWR
jgi:hypothetical protein